MFAIKTAADFLAKVEEDLKSLNEQPDDSGRAMNCILSAYHLHEWVWAKHLKSLKPVCLRGDWVRDKEGFDAWLDSNCPNFALVQELANGTKHCLPGSKSERIAGYGQGPYGIGPYGKPYLLVDLGEHKAANCRWAVAHSMLAETIGFWRDFYAEHKVS